MEQWTMDLLPPRPQPSAKVSFARPLRRYVLPAALFVLAILYLTTSTPRIPLFVKSTIPFRRSSYSWTQHIPTNPVPHPRAELPQPPERPLDPIPRIQKHIPPDPADAPSRERAEAVRKVFLRSYRAYRDRAWLHDELLPVSGSSADPFGGWAATLIDSLDTLWIMGLHEEFVEAATAAAQIDWGNTTAAGINLFETTIRHLGGLISAYDLSGEVALLRKAIELGDMIYAAFDTPNRLPPFYFSFEKAREGSLVAGGADPAAGPTSLSLEMTRLAQITGSHKYYDAIDRVARFLERIQMKSRIPGLFPRVVNFAAEWGIDERGFTLGADVDSLYEYLPKMHLLLGGREPLYEKLYTRSLDPIRNHLLFRPMLENHEEIIFAGDVYATSDEEHTIKKEPLAQHLACFAGGMFGLAGRIFADESQVDLGERMARSCAWAYSRFASGIMPEMMTMFACEGLRECSWDVLLWEESGDPLLPKGFRKIDDPRYLLRPEAIESIFLLYRITGKRDLRDIAWTMFQAITKATETDIAYSAIEDVRGVGETKKLDSMESFWLSETLKYFYLIFSSSDLISLDDYVFNTEAHPFRRTY